MEVFGTERVEERDIDANVIGRTKPTGLAAVRTNMLEFARLKPFIAPGRRLRRRRSRPAA